MTINTHLREFAGKLVVDWNTEEGLLDPAGMICRISIDYEEAEAGVRWTDKLASLLDDPASGQVTGLVVGFWDTSTASEDDSSAVVEALVAASRRLPELRALFVGDIIYEESEISWIRQSDLSPLFVAYPQLEHFASRGGEGLSLGRLRHQRLKSLVVQSGGLPASVVREVASAELPELEHLELWLGSDSYGGDATIEDLAPILSGVLFPKLRYLGLRDSEIADQIAQAVAQAPILERVRVLDLSLGTLGDEGAAALLASPLVARLEKLDIHHHYCSRAMVKKLMGLGIEVDASDVQQADEDDGRQWRYAAVTE